MFNVAGQLRRASDTERLKIHVHVPGDESRLTLKAFARLALLGLIHGGLLPAAKGAADNPNLIGDVMRKVKDELFLGRRCRKILLARRRRQEFILSKILSRELRLSPEVAVNQTHNTIFA